MRIASSFSVDPHSGDAGAGAAQDLLARLGGRPDLVVLYTTEHHARPELLGAIREALPEAQIVGGTSCGGVMTERGFHASAHGAVGLLGIADADGSFGVGSAPVAQDAFLAGAQAIEAALTAAERDFEAPVLVWCCQPPGREEAVIEGIQSVVGAKVPIIGGSSADEGIAGAWRQFSTDGVLQDHVVVAALFPTAGHGAAFQSGYAPAGPAGVVTKAQNRQVLEIDHQPASEVYSRWTDGEVPASDIGMILAKSTPTPLGRVAGQQNNVPMFVLSHPAMMGAGGDLSLFTDITEGDEVHLMRGSPASLVKRAGLVVNDAIANGGWRREETAGGLVIYCGGCMLHVRDRMPEVAEQVAEAMHGAPFLGAFTFGEQGAIIDSCNRHGNLMVSALTFG
ncbi:FIST signal transduction protein [Phenylobacterium deserti]|uniref:Histidine kinase n=1 Tax=Phenylobacterium deserti TaxID=1914756 RepID=A0A328AT26_9CAUL|nr:FIST N-terminal domain-containing protein [Phenylobacterium deserti]RAK57757.1 hypothetical protein DJ018_07500 [Phenylobacterium deserti]